jgi:hypothetical protein
MKNLALAVCLSIAISTLAFASPSVQYVDSYGQTASITSTYYTGSVNAGIYHIKVDGVQQNSFCIDLADTATTSPTAYSAVSLSNAPDAPVGAMGATKATALSKLWTMAYSPTMTQSQAAAFQLAVWDIVTDLDYNVTSGNFRVTGSDYGAQTLLNSLKTYAGAGANLTALSNATYQDYVVSSVPAPGALGLGGLGLALLRWVRSRRRI